MDIPEHKEGNPNQIWKYQCANINSQLTGMACTKDHFPYWSVHLVSENPLDCPSLPYKTSAYPKQQQFEPDQCLESQEHPLWVDTERKSEHLSTCAVKTIKMVCDGFICDILNCHLPLFFIASLKAA